jgi:molybdopterin-guanine dinucleotide biosynthesis protein A
MEISQHVIGVVLAGGRSSRMGGGVKTLRELGGRPLLAHVIARLEPQVTDIVISTNGDLSDFAAFGWPVVADSLPGFQGPLAGIEAGLAWAAENCPGVSAIVTVPGDTPFIPGDLVRRLTDAGNVAVARTDEGVHPVVGLWPLAVAGNLKAALANGLRRVSRWAEMQSATEVVFPPVEIGRRTVDPFFNINRPEDLAEAEALLAMEPRA